MSVSEFIPGYSEIDVKIRQNQADTRCIEVHILACQIRDRKYLIFDSRVGQIPKIDSRTEKYGGRLDNRSNEKQIDREYKSVELKLCA